MVPTGPQGDGAAWRPSDRGDDPKSSRASPLKARSSTSSPPAAGSKPRRIWGMGPMAVGASMEVPEVPTISPPPLPTAAGPGAQQCGCKKELQPEPGGEASDLAADLRRATEALGKVLCCRLDDMEGALERAMERILEAALARALAAEKLGLLVRQTPRKDDAACAAGTMEPAEYGGMSEVSDSTHTKDPASPLVLSKWQWPPNANPNAAVTSPCSPFKATSLSGANTLSSLQRVETPNLFMGESGAAHRRRVPVSTADCDGVAHRCSGPASSHTTISPGMWPVWCTEAHAEDAASHHTEETVHTRVDVSVRLRELEKGGVEKVSSLNLPIELPANCSIERSRSVVMDHKSRLQRWVMHPASNPILFWHVLGPFLLAYDIVMIPMHTFPLAHHQVTDILAIISTSYWSLDTVRGFFTGYETEDTVEMRPGLIARRYLKSWFFLDLFTCCLDWAFLIGGSQGMFNKFWRTSRAVKAWRILRLVRLVRLVKYYNRLSALMDKVLSMQTMLLLKSLYILAAICFFCHYTACYWYAVGDIGMPLHIWEPSENWLHEYKLENAGFYEIYATCFQWALGQSGFCPTNVLPTNPEERIFASCVSFMWLLIMSGTINLFGMWLSQLRDSNKDREMQWMNLRRYLDEHEVSRKLTYRVLRCFRAHYHKHRRRIHEEDIEFLGDLPLVLKVNVHKEVYLPVLKTHLFFDMIGRVSERLLLMICHLAMHEEHHLAGAVVFQEDTIAQNMYHTLVGRLDYYAVYNEMRCTPISAGEWACEPALWLRWELRGRLVSVSSSELVGVDADKFHAIIMDSKQKGDEVETIRRFAVSVCEHFVGAYPETDLWRDTQEIEIRMEEAFTTSDSWQQY